MLLRVDEEPRFRSGANGGICSYRGIKVPFVYGFVKGVGQFVKEPTAFVTDGLPCRVPSPGRFYRFNPGDSL